MSRGQRKANGAFDFPQTPSHLFRRCQQYLGDVYARKTPEMNLTRQQYLVLSVLDHEDGMSQTALVDVTGIDRSTLAEMIRRLLPRGFVARKQAENDARANVVTITVAGRRALKSARPAAESAEREVLEALPGPERTRLLKLLAIIAAAGEQYSASNGSRSPRRPGSRRL